MKEIAIGNYNNPDFSQFYFRMYKYIEENLRHEYKELIDFLFSQEATTNYVETQVLVLCYNKRGTRVVDKRMSLYKLMPSILRIERYNGTDEIRFATTNIYNDNVIRFVPMDDIFSRAWVEDEIMARDSIEGYDDLFLKK